MNPISAPPAPAHPATVGAPGNMSPQAFSSTPLMQPLNMAAMPGSMSAQAFPTGGMHGGHPPSPSMSASSRGPSSVQPQPMGILPSPRSLQRSEVEDETFHVTPDARDKYSHMFDAVDVNRSGFVTGAQARVALSQSGLPTVDLRKIWDLADAGKDGKLDRQEFVVCQFLIAHRLAGHDLPDTLPVGLQDVQGLSQSLSSSGVDGRGALNLMAPMRMGADAGPASPPPAVMYPPPPSPPQVVQQQSQHRTVPMVLPTSTPQLSTPQLTSYAPIGDDGSSAAPSPSGRFLPNGPSRTKSGDDIELQDYSRFVELFRNIDTDADGYISGPEARPLLTQSELPTTDLRKIWDLADMTSDGRLNHHEFAVAMILVQARQKGAALPDILPAHLRSPPEVFEASNSRTQRAADMSSQSSFSSAGVPSSNVSPMANTGVAGSSLTHSMAPSPIVQSASTSLPPTASDFIQPMQAGAETPESLAFEDAVEHTPTLAVGAPGGEAHELAAAYAKFASNFALLDSDSDGFITGGEARPVLAASGLPTGVLRQIWDLADLGADGMLDQHEFVVAMHLIEQCQQGEAVPAELPREYRTFSRETLNSPVVQPVSECINSQQAAPDPRSFSVQAYSPDLHDQPMSRHDQPMAHSLLPQPINAGGETCIMDKQGSITSRFEQS